MKNQIAIYSKDPVRDLKIIEDIRALFFKKYTNIDFNIFSDIDVIPSCDYAIMSSYYMIHYRGVIVFLDTDDLLEYRDSVIGSVYIYIDNKSLTTNTYYNQLVKEYSILIYNDKDQMELISNEIRQSIRQ